MKKINCILIGLLLSFYSLAASMGNIDKNNYLVISHHPHVLTDIDPYVELVKNSGRHRVVKIIKSIPDHLKKYLRPIKLSELRSYQPQVIAQDSLDPKLVKLLAKMDQRDLQHIVSTLSSFEKRRARSVSNKQATDWFKRELEKLGLVVVEDCFRANTCNLYAKKIGNRSNKKTILVEAHIDDVGHQHAGADDNASGVAGLYIIAKTLKNMELNNDVLFFVTNAEESGLVGANHFVKKLSQSGELSKIGFVINMDMIGYNQNGLIDIETNREFEDVANWMSQVVVDYTSLTPNITIPAWGSDHVPFLKKGITSILTIEHWGTKTPCYHRSCDKPDHLNYEYALEISRLNVASIILRDSL